MHYECSELPSGTKVFTVPMKDRRSATVAIWVRTGSRYESQKLAGISHFLEHMVFKGTRTRTAREIKESIEGSGGLLNAYTGEESTCYYAKVRAEDAGNAFGVLADMVAEPLLDPQEVEKERGVILEEIKMYRDQPSAYVQEMIGEVVWPAHPLGRPIAGEIESVSGIGDGDLKAYQALRYQPRNLVIGFSGNVGHRQALRWAREAFAGLRKPGIPGFESARSVKGARRPRLVPKKIGQIHFVMAFPGVSKHHHDRYLSQVLHVLLGANMSSRLFEEVREKRGLAYDIRTQVQFFEETGLFTVYGGVEKDKAKDAVRVVWEELRRIAREPVPGAELRRAKDYLLGQLDFVLEDTLEHALWLGEKVLYEEKLHEPEKIRKIVSCVSPAGIRRLARAMFTKRQMRMAVLGPKVDTIGRAVAALKG
ncbi:MAG: M16 family metallopeptidase [Candidatus Omnitrophota bacterium]